MQKRILAKKFQGEIVSADSRQVYRYMDIGTGKDVGKENQWKQAQSVVYKEKHYDLGTYTVDGVAVWMLDVVYPDDPFSVSQYQFLASHIISDIIKRGKVPIVVGGTGLYIQSLIAPFDVHVEPDEKLRASLATYSLSLLQKKLQEVGKDMWDMMNESDRKNPRRLIRKIEIAQTSEKTTQISESPYDVCEIGLQMDAKALYTKIDERVTKRIEEGVEKEINALLHKGYTWDLPSMSSLGYREWRAYMEGTATKEDVITRWKFDEHGYARRQMTWFRHDKIIHWFDVQKDGVQKEIESYVASWYTHV